MTFPIESTAMRFLRRAGLERVAWSLRRLHCPVPPDALVLDVGSGGNPYPRADVLLDAYEASRERHWVPLKVDRPTVLGFVENLPFRDHAFDFVIASHVLEHSADPARFLSELQRVARAGYIETPDAFMERVNPYRDHRLEVTVRDARLVIRKKPAWVVDAELVELYEHQAKPFVTRCLIPNRPFAFHVRFYWEGEIPFTVVNAESDAGWTPPPGGASTHGPFARGIKGSALVALRGLFSHRARNRAPDLARLLRCPRCRATEFDTTGESLRCRACGTDYSVRDGIPVMTAERPA